MLKIMISSLIVSFALLSPLAKADAPSDSRESLKQQIFQLAQSYEGQGDPDQSKQKSLEVLVKQLVAMSPMPPVRERLSVIAGAWKQVWGPYDYRNENGGVDPTLGLREIYQVVSAEGYYYNIAPYYPDKDQNPQREQIGLLRGEFELDPSEANSLQVKFTNYPGVEPRPTNLNLWELAPLAEAGQLENEITIVPTIVVRLFFGGGRLEEIYTDHDMRLLYGTTNRAGARKSLYVMKRMN